jgi:nucleoside 2-deoxyribosyltransferase
VTAPCPDSRGWNIPVKFFQCLENPLTIAIMKIYFAGSIRGGRDYAKTYYELISHIEQHATVLTEHIRHDDLTTRGEETLSDQEIYARDMSWLNESDAIIAEVSAPSLGVGYELGQAEEMGKPILCLFDGRSDARLSAMLSGHPAMKVVCYQNLDEAKASVDVFLQEL